ncbi:MAG: DUF3310 domain-containing protein [Clostridia bacterium]|nr:DUF3310 domain-containing protein [Clostridia bacterium]
MSDSVNHPDYYNTGKIEVIDFIESWGFGFHLGNAVKYISRAGKKDPAKTIQDLEKAIWYIKRAKEYGVNAMRIQNHILLVDYCKDKELSPLLTSAMMQMISGNFHLAVDLITGYIDQLRKGNEGVA